MISYKDDNNNNNNNNRSCLGSARITLGAMLKFAALKVLKLRPLVLLVTVSWGQDKGLEVKVKVNGRENKLRIWTEFYIFMAPTKTKFRSNWEGYLFAKLLTVMWNGCRTTMRHIL